MTVNNTDLDKALVGIGINGFTIIHPHSTLTVPTFQAGHLHIFIYDDTVYARARLSVTIVS